VGSIPAENDGFLRARKISSTTSFGREVKPAVPFRKILWHDKEPYEYESDTCRQNSRTFLAKFLLIRY
jgi:hypothetical protein